MHGAKEWNASDLKNWSTGEVSPSKPAEAQTKGGCLLMLTVSTLSWCSPIASRVLISSSQTTSAASRLVTQGVPLESTLADRT